MSVPFGPQNSISNLLNHDLMVVANFTAAFGPKQELPLHI